MRMVVSTAPANEAASIARRLVEEKLVACVNIVPKVRSIYTWEGKICDDEESILLMKTTKDRVSLLTRRIVELHSYDVPEIVTMTLNKNEGNPDYLRWVREMVSG